MTKPPKPRANPKADKPATMPKAPRTPSAKPSEMAKKVLADDTDERREAARTYLEAERQAARSGLEIPDLPLGKPDPR